MVGSHYEPHVFEMSSLNEYFIVFVLSQQFQGFQGLLC